MFFLFLHEHICCWYSEAPCRGASNEYPQHMFSLRNKNDISIFRMKKAPYQLLRGNSHTVYQGDTFAVNKAGILIQKYPFAYNRLC